MHLTLDGQRVLDWLGTTKGRTVWVITHESPDGDAIGSVLAAQELLRQCGAEAQAFCPDPAPRIYDFLPGVQGIRHLTPGAPDNAPREVPFAYVYVDCGDAARTGSLAGALAPGPTVVNIDHHRSNRQFGNINWVDPSASSTGEMLAMLFLALGVPFGVARDCLYAGIVTDTGSFSYEGTTALTHQVAASLLAAGASPSELYDRIYNSREPAVLALIGAAISSLRLSADGRVAVMVLRPEDFQRTGARPEYTEGIVNYARSLASVEIGVLLHSSEVGQVRGSVRTRPGVPADQLAAAFGGGGHARAAGFRLAGDLDEVAGRVFAVAGQFRSQR